MGQDLMHVMAFQKELALVVCDVLESTFEDNYIMTTFKVLGLSNVPSK